MDNKIKIGIHQPNFLPWLGYFYKMARCDTFVVLDNVQYEKNGYTNRCQIKTPQGATWLTLSIKRIFPQLIKDSEIVDYSLIKSKLLKNIQFNYSKVPYFEHLFPELSSILEKDWANLSTLNIELIKLVKNELGIKTKIEIASNYNFTSKSTDLLIDICKYFKANVYLSGKGGQKYQEEEKFTAANIKLEYTNFIHPTYPQLWGEFIPNLSIIDLLFNCGQESLKILLSSFTQNK